MNEYTVNGKPLESKEQALLALCNTANCNCLRIHDLWCYKDICEQFNITEDDYYNDVEGLSQEHIDNAGDDNWKPIKREEIIYEGFIQSKSQLENI